MNCILAPYFGFKDCMCLTEGVLRVRVPIRAVYRIMVGFLTAEVCSFFSVPSTKEEFEVHSKSLFKELRKNVWAFRCFLHMV